MKKVGKSTKKGFTLVELIVVLVILAVLAAMLVPALTGYIQKAKEEKEFQTAATVYTAAQAVITEKYGKNADMSSGQIAASDTKATTLGDYEKEVITLAGVDTKAVTAYGFTYDTNTYIITGGYVTISGSTYVLTIDTTTGAPSWTTGSVPAAFQSGSGTGGAGGTT